MPDITINEVHEHLTKTVDALESMGTIPPNVIVNLRQAAEFYFQVMKLQYDLLVYRENAEAFMSISEIALIDMINIVPLSVACMSSQKIKSVVTGELNIESLATAFTQEKDVYYTNIMKLLNNINEHMMDIDDDKLNTFIIERFKVVDSLVISFLDDIKKYKDIKIEDSPLEDLMTDIVSMTIYATQICRHAFYMIEYYAVNNIASAKRPLLIISLDNCVKFLNKGGVQ